MAKPKFRWTRSKYKHAHHLLRLLSRMRELPYGDAPLIVQRLWALQEARPQRPDPLLTPMRFRSHYEKFGDGIPF